MTDIYQTSESLENTNSEFVKPSLSAYNDQHFSKYVNSYLSNANNSEDFYNKLVELKNEQKKTLLFMQELYNQKQVLREEILKSENDLKDLKTTTYPLKAEDYKFHLNTVSAYETNPHSHFLSIENKSEPEHKDELVVNTEKYKLHSKPPVPHKTTTVTFQNAEKIEISPRLDKSTKIYDSVDDDLKKIEKIWNEFSLNDNQTLKSIEFNTRFEKKKKKPTKSNYRTQRPASAQVEWAPRVTIPEPFSMTIREKIKADKKVKLAREMQDEREKRIENEIRECKRKFKASPVPHHVMLPLYEQKKVGEEIRKHKIKKMSKEYMEKVSKPFNLTESKRFAKERSHSFSEGDNNTTEVKTNFNAQPIPDFYFDDENVKEKMQELELYKQIKSQIRALELLKQSKLPQNMELQNEKKKLEQERNEILLNEMNRIKKEIEKKELRKKKYKFTHEVPDYDALYKKFIIELEMKKAQNRKHTKVEPFVLRSESRSRKNSATSKNDENVLVRSSSMSRLSQSVAASMDAMPIRANTSHKLRESVNKEKINDIVKRELQQEHIEKFKKLREKKLHDQIQEKIKYDPKEIDKNLERQTRKLRMDQRTREEEYEREIANMEKSIETRKLQIEKFEEANIKKAIEKKYQEALRKAGLNEADLNKLKKTEQIARQVKHSEPDEWITS